MLHECTTTGKLPGPEMLAGRIVTWGIYDLYRWVIADAVAHLRLPPRSYKAAPSVPSVLLDVFLDVLGEDLDSECKWDLLDILLSGVIDIRCSLRGDFLLIKEKCYELSISRPSNAGDVF